MRNVRTVELMNGPQKGTIHETQKHVLIFHELEPFVPDPRRYTFNFIQKPREHLYSSTWVPGAWFRKNDGTELWWCRCPRCIDEAENKFFEYMVAMKLEPFVLEDP